MQAALRRQHAAAEACSPGIAVGPRRVCVTFVSDMKGLMQICGHAGPSATFNCLLCEARLNQTAKAGVPHLPVLPEPYKSQDIREADIINPPARKGTDQLGEYARAYAAAASAPNAAKELSSAEYKSCSQEPMIWSDDLSEHLSRTPLHITLGLGTNYIHAIKAEAIELDAQWAMNVSNPDLLDDFITATGEATVARAEVERTRDEAESKSVGMAICLEHDSSAARTGKADAKKDAHAWIIKYRALKKERDAALAAATASEKKAVTAEKAAATAKIAILGGEAEGGPFTKAYHAFLKHVGISEAVYFGGTFIGPYIEKVLGSADNVKRLASIVGPQRVECPDGVWRTFGSETRVTELLTVLTPFSRLHRLYNKKNGVCDHERASFKPLTEEHAVAFAKVFRTTQPTPKMHVLCFHMDELMQRRGSIGIDTEQGIESFHPEYTYVLNMFRHMDRQPEKQLEAVVSRLWTRGGGKRARGSEGVKETKQARDEKMRAQRKSIK